MISQGYLNRALRARDPRFVTILTRLGHLPVAPRPEPEPGAPALDDLTAAQNAFRAIFGREPDPRWRAETLRRRIAEGMS